MSHDVDKQEEPSPAHTTETSPQEGGKCLIDKLPPEITDEIILYLKIGLEVDGPKLAKYGTLVQNWVEPIRRILFRKLSITDSPEDCENLAKIVTPELGQLVKQLNFSIFLPCSATPHVGHVKRDGDVDIEDNATIFERSIASLLRIMARWHHDGQASGVELDIGTTTSWIDTQYRRYFKSPFESPDRFPKLQESRPKYVRFSQGGEALPVVTCVNRLNLKSCFTTTHATTNRAIGLTTWLELLAKTPSATSTRVGVGFPEWQDDQQRRDDRNGLAKMLRDDGRPSSSNLRDVHLEVRPPFATHLGESLSPYSFDALSASIRNWSHNLVHLHLKGIFDQSLFWPQHTERDGYEATAEPVWPNLETFMVRLYPQAPSGMYHLLPGDHHRLAGHGHGSEQGPVPPPQPFHRVNRSRNAREIPCPETFEPVVEAWAQALTNMPSLKNACLETSGYLDEGINRINRLFPWSMTYLAPGVVVRPGAGFEQHRRLEFENLMGWRPDDSTMDKLLRVGEKADPGAMKILEIGRCDLPPLGERDPDPPSEGSEETPSLAALVESLLEG